MREEERKSKLIFWGKRSFKIERWVTEEGMVEDNTIYRIINNCYFF